MFEGDDGGIVVVAVVLTVFVGVLIIIVWGVFKLSVCYVVVVINTIDKIPYYIHHTPLQPYQYQYNHDTAST